MATAYRWSEADLEGRSSRPPNRSGSSVTAAPPAHLLRSRSSQPLTPDPARAVRNFAACTVRDDESGASAEKRKAVPSRLFGAVRSKHFKKPALVEFCTVKRIDNSRLVRRVEPVKLRNLYKTVALGGIIAVFCMMYIYQHFRCIDLSFQLEDLRGKQVQAQSLNSELKLEIETLRDPQRIDVIAQKQLGLKRPESAQVREYATVDGSQVAAVQYGRGNRP